MTNRVTSGPAFAHGNPEQGGDAGMTLRQWYAGQALIGLCAHSGSFGLNNGPGELSKRAYQIADAMVDEGNKP